MRRAAGTGLVRVLLALLSGAAVVLGLAPPSPARAAEPEALVRITLTGMTPALPQRDGTVTLTGRVQNVTQERLFRLQAIFWRDQAPITTSEGVQQALQSESNVPIGARQTDFYQDLYTPDDPYLEPGATADFSVTAPVAQLQLAPTDGVYLMGVHVLQNGNLFAVGRARAFVPVLQDEPADDLQLTSLVVLSSRPSQLRPGVLLDDHLAQEVAPGGRLARLLESADSAGVSFAVDPALVEELETMRSGYTVDAGDGPTPGRGQADAASWLQRFGQLSAAHDGFQLLYGSPDVAALAHDRQTSVLGDALAAGRRVGATARLPLLVLPADGRADATTLRAAEQLDPAAVLLSDQSAVGDGPLLRGEGGDVPVIRYGSGSSGGGGPGPDPRDSAVQVRQRVLADTWIEASEAGDGATRGRVRLVTDTNQVQGEDAGVEAPWLTRTTLGRLLEGTPAPWDGELTYPEEAREAELTPDQLAAQRQLVKSYRTYAELLVDPTRAKVNGQAAAARAASAAWRGQEELRSPYLAHQQDDLDAVLDQVQISTNPKVSTVAREGVEFPITILNLLPADADDPAVNAVKLRLVFVSDNRQRLTIRPIEAPLVLAEGNVTARARVTARANGTVPVRAQLQTMDGTPVGEARRIDVRVTQNGTTGWAIAAAALVLFGGGTALRVRQVGKARARTDADAASPPSALTSAPPADAPGTSRPLPPEADHDA